jgi:hypothetical protein
MSSATIEAPERANALRACRAALRRFAGNELDPMLDKRMLELGERKESPGLRLDGMWSSFGTRSTRIR